MYSASQKKIQLEKSVHTEKFQNIFKILCLFFQMAKKKYLHLNEQEPILWMVQNPDLTRLGIVLAGVGANFQSCFWDTQQSKTHPKCQVHTWMGRQARIKNEQSQAEEHTPHLRHESRPTEWDEPRNLKEDGVGASACGEIQIKMQSSLKPSYNYQVSVIDWKGLSSRDKRHRDVRGRGHVTFMIFRSRRSLRCLCILFVRCFFSSCEWMSNS